MISPPRMSALAALIGALVVTRANAAPRALELADVLASTERAHPTIAAALADHAGAEADLLSERGQFDPTWQSRASAQPLGYYGSARVDTNVTVPTPVWGSSLFAGWRYGDASVPSYYGNIVTNAAGEVRAGAQLPLWRNGPIDRRRAAIARAEAGVGIAKLGVDATKLELQRLASVRYWDWVGAGAKLEVAEKLLELAKARASATQTRAASGDVPAIDVTENERAIRQREGQVASARRALEQAALELSIYLRDEEGRPTVVPRDRLPDAIPSIPAPAPGEEGSMAQLARTRRPEPRRFELSARQLSTERDLAENQSRPAIDVVVAVTQDLGRNPDPLDRSRDPFTLEASVLVDVPIFNRSAEGRFRAAQAKLKRNQEQARLVGDRIDAEVSDARSALRAATERVEVAKQEVGLAVELERAERLRYERGDGNLMMVNLREQATAEARVREIDAQLDVRRAIAAFRAASGASP